MRPQRERRHLLSAAAVQKDAVEAAAGADHEQNRGGGAQAVNRELEDLIAREVLPVAERPEGKKQRDGQRNDRARARTPGWRAAPGSAGGGRPTMSPYRIVRPTSARYAPTASMAAGCGGSMPCTTDSPATNGIPILTSDMPVFRAIVNTSGISSMKPT